MFGQHMMPPTGVFVKAVEPPTDVSESVAPPARPGGCREILADMGKHGENMMLSFQGRNITAC